jgi:hypothetical protein
LDYTSEDFINFHGDHSDLKANYIYKSYRTMLPDAVHFGYPGRVQTYGEMLYPGSMAVTCHNPVQNQRGDWNCNYGNIVISLTIHRSKLEEITSAMKNQLEVLRQTAMARLKK